MDVFTKIVLPILGLLFGGGIFWKFLESRKKPEPDREPKPKNLELKNGTFIERVPIPVGSFVEIYDGKKVAYRVTCVQITTRKVPIILARLEEEELVAELEFHGSGRLFHPSEYVLNSGVNCFFMPVMGHHYRVVYDLYHSEDKVYSFMAYVDHIDTNKEIVHLQLAIDF
jgi:hypothetical protein